MISSEHIIDQLKQGADWNALSRESWKPSDVGALVEAIRKQLHVDPKIAARLSDTARKVAESLDDAWAEAEASVGTALVRRNAGAFEKSLGLLDEAVEEFERLEDRTQAAKARTERVRPLMYLSRYEEAMAICDEAMPRLTEEPDRARLNVNAGIVFAKKGQFQEAKTKLLEAIRMFKRCGMDWEAALAQANMATVYLSTDEIGPAREVFDQCASIFREEGMRVASAKVDLERSFFAERMGRYDEALKFLEEGDARFTELGMHAEAAIAQLHAAEVYLRINLLDEALTTARNASSAFKSLSMRTNHARSQAVEGKTLGRAGRIADAQEILKSCRTTFEELGVPTQVAEVDWDLSELALASGDLREALEAAQRARNFFSREGLIADRLRVDLNLAEIYRRWGWNQQAHRMWENALGEAEGRHLEEIACKAEHGLGKVREAEGATEEASVWYMRAIERLERMRALLGIEAQRISFSERRMNLYEDAVALCLKQGHTEMAFDLVERSKSRTLVDVLEDRATGRRARDRIRNLRERLIYLHEKAHSAAEGEDAGQTQDRGRRIAEMERVLSGAEKARVHGTGETVSLKAAQQVIDRDTAVLEYYEMRDTLMVFVIRQNHWDLAELRSPSDRIERAILQWEFNIEQFDFGPKIVEKRRNQWTRNAKLQLGELYNLLIRPIRKKLQRTTKWIIIPHGSLHKVPFHALWDGTAYVNDQVEVSYAPSLTVLSHCLRGREGEWESGRARERETPPLPFTPSPHRGVMDERRALVMGVPDERMPRVEEEVRGVARTFPGSEVLLGEQATTEAFYRREGTYDVVHLACHGVFRQDNPGYSSLRFEDGSVTADGIRAMDLEASLVTLSACESGTSAVVGGDELLGMVRGFLSAGARSLLVSLWRTDDFCTAELMLSFYEHWSAGATRAEALRKAQCKVREQAPHPYYWAPFVLIGRGD